jgi:hypothetical protein
MRKWKSRRVPPEIKVGMVVVAYKRPQPLSCLLYSLLSQTHGNFEALVIHDGPGPEVREVVTRIDDPRIRLTETDVRRGQYGHPLREKGLQLCSGDYLGTTNDDNYYAPVYFEWMLHQLLRDEAQFAYCNFVRSHRQWQAYSTKPEKSKLDCGAWLAQAELVKSTPWTDFSHTGDGTFIEAMVARAEGLTKVEGYLFVHN